jgi:hypothetical protein
MSIQRSEYFKDLVADAKTVSIDPEIVAALVTSDALNGIRKSVLDLADAIRTTPQQKKPNDLINTDR